MSLISYPHGNLSAAYLGTTIPHFHNLLAAYLGTTILWFYFILLFYSWLFLILFLIDFILFFS